MAHVVYTNKRNLHVQSYFNSSYKVRLLFAFEFFEPFQFHSHIN